MAKSKKGGAKLYSQQALLYGFLLSYAWQLYLPRLPFMQDPFGFWPPYTTWARAQAST